MISVRANATMDWRHSLEFLDCGGRESRLKRRDQLLPTGSLFVVPAYEDVYGFRTCGSGRSGPASVEFIKWAHLRHFETSRYRSMTGPSSR